MNKQSVYRLAILLFPVVSLFVALVVIIFESHRFQQLSHDLKSTEEQTAQLAKLIKDLEAQPPVSVIPVVAQSQVEQPDFLNLLRTYALVTHIQLTRWSNTGVATGAPGNEPGKKGLPADVTSITSSIEVAGKYNDLRHFLYSLESAPRLLTLSDVALSRNEKYPILFLKFNLTRYVVPPGHGPERAIAPGAAGAVGQTVSIIGSPTSGGPAATGPKTVSPTPGNPGAGSPIAGGSSTGSPTTGGSTTPPQASSNTAPPSSGNPSPGPSKQIPTKGNR